MAENVKFQIIGVLNTGATIGEINSALKGIEKKINKLKLNVEINEKVLSTLNTFNKQMQELSNTARNTGKTIAETILPDGTKVKTTYFDDMSKGFQQIVEDAKNVKSATEQTNNSIDIQSRSVKDLTANYRNLAKEIKNYNADNSIKSKTSTYLNDEGNARVIKADANNNVISVKDINNYEALVKEQEKARKSLQDLARTGQYANEELRKIGTGIYISKTIKEIEQLNNRMNNMRFGNGIVQDQEKLRQSLLKVYNQGKVNEKFFNNFNKVINSANNVREIEKVEKALQRVNQNSINKSLQQKLVNDAETLLRTHSKTVDTQGVKDLINGLNQISPSATNASNQLKNAEVQLKGFSSGAKEAAHSSMTLGQMLTTAFQKFPIWMISATAFYAPIRALSDMTSRLIEIDTLMTDINRVMDIPEFKLTDMLNEATDASDQLSSKLTDFLGIMNEFGRMGFQEDQLLDISKTAQVLQNISDLDANASVDTLTSAMLNFNVAAKDSITIADQLNEVD